MTQLDKDGRTLTRVLVVEDEPGTRRFLTDLLSDEGYDVIAAHDGAHALRLVAAGRPDLILLDFGLPVLDGEEFALQWRERRPGEQVPIIGMSALREGAEIARRLEVAAFFPKPLDSELLLDAVREHTGGARDAEELSAKRS